MGVSETMARQEMSGTPSLTFNDNDTLPDTIVRSAGSWVDDGFAAGQIIRVDGSGASDGLYKIASINGVGDTLTLIATDQLKNGVSTSARVSTAQVAAADTITRNTGDWLADGFLAGQTITVANAGVNSGTYQIGSVSADTLTLTSEDRLTDALPASGVSLRSGDTITRNTGSWLADGFEAGQTIVTTGAGANNGSFKIEKVSKTTLTLVPAAALSDGTSTGGTLTTDPNASTAVISAGGDIDLKALSGPQVYSLTLAGSQSTQKDNAEAGAASATSGSPSGAADAAGDTGGAGVGISGSVSLNTVNLTTSAYISEAYSVDAQNLRFVAITTGAPRLSGSPALAFAANGTAADTITRSTGDWLADGFRAGQSIKVDGAVNAGNKGTWRIASLTATTLTLTPDATLADENVSVQGTASDGEVIPNVTIVAGAAMTGNAALTFDAVTAAQDTIERSEGNWLADGFRPGMKIKVSGSAHNNGEFEVVDVTATTLTLSGNLINETLTDEADVANVAVTAADDGTDTRIIAIAGAATISTEQGGGAGIAGSFTMNTVDASTNAYLQRTDASIAGDLVISARTPAQIFSIGASVSASTGSGKANLAGQVSYNNITNETRAYINDAIVSGPDSSSAKPDVVLRAVDDSYILAVAGAVAYGGKAGIGASVSINTIGNITEAFIRNSHVSAASVAALAESGTQITSVTAAIGGSTGLMAAEAAVSVNVVSNTTNAFISGRKSGQGVVSTGGMSLIASDASAITADAGGVSVRGGTGSGGSLRRRRGRQRH